MKFADSYARLLSALLAIGVAAAPQFANAQETQPAQAQPTTIASPTQQQAPASQQQTPAQQAPGSGTVDPSAPPLAPAQQQPPEQQLPTAPSATQQGSSAQGTQRQTQPQSKPTEPLGTAAAESVRTVGGGASRPAGTAIAPAKQRQRRSLLIKVGALAAVGAAAGIIYGLTRATSSVPPNTR